MERRRGKSVQSSISNAAWSLLLLAFLLLNLAAAAAYITSHAALPAHRQRKWLKELTHDFLQVEPGQLSRTDLAVVAPELLFAWSHCRKTNGAECALAMEALMHRVVQEQETGNTDYSGLTIDDYNCLLEGWARSGKGVAAAERSEQILTELLESGPSPNLSTFKAVLMAWRQAWQADYSALRAQRILESMIRLEDEELLPDADCFDVVLQLWSRSGLAQAPQQTENLVAVMERLYKSTGLERVKPRTTSFNAILATWSRSKQPTAAVRASHILGFMEMMNAQGDASCAPDIASYCTVIGCLAATPQGADRLVAAEQGDAFLSNICAAYANEGKTALAPDTILFNTVMGCWTKTQVSGAYRRTRSILDRQIKLYSESGCTACKPDIYSFTSVIASCAAERGGKGKGERLKAFNVALGTYSQLKRASGEFGVANHVTYGAILKACVRLIHSASPLKEKWLRRIFTDCCADGCVGELALNRLKEGASPALYKELMRGYTRKTIPAEWTRNVKGAQPSQMRPNGAKKSRRKRAEV